MEEVFLVLQTHMEALKHGNKVWKIGFFAEISQKNLLSTMTEIGREKNHWYIDEI